MCAQVIRKRVFDHLLKVFITRLGLEGSNEKVFLVMFLYFVVPAVIKYSATRYFIILLTYSNFVE